VAGKRKIMAFGEQLYLAPETVFPDYYNFKLPKNRYPYRIVQYADFVQLNAVCAHLQRASTNPIVVDIGAHHGSYAIVCGKIAQKNGGKVIAVEPNPSSFETLKKNIELNSLEDTIFPINCGVLDTAGEMSIDDRGVQSQLGVTQGLDGGTVVEITTLGEIFTQYQIDRVDILIVDVEGAELPVLRGLPWGEITVEKILCELHPYDWQDFSYDDKAFSDFLKDHSLRCFDMYFHEHDMILQKEYIGPTLLVQDWCE
jgi:FkbM family methyltransferase